MAVAPALLEMRLSRLVTAVLPKPQPPWPPGREPPLGFFEEGSKRRGVEGLALPFLQHFSARA